VGAIDRKLPLAPEVAFNSALRRGRDDRDEQSAVVNLLADLAVPGIPTPQLALIEPNLDAAGPKRFANALRRLGILRRIAQEDSFIRFAHAALPTPDRSAGGLRGILSPIHAFVSRRNALN